MIKTPLKKLLALAISCCFLIFGLGCSASFDHHYLRYDERIYGDKPVDAEEVWIKSSDLQLHGWLRIPDQEVRGGVIHFHGNGRNISHHVLYTDWLVEEGFAVLTFDYRGYGRSGGLPSLDGMVEDDEAVIRFFESRFRDLPVIIFAQSLGANMALLALEQYQPEKLVAVILDSPVSSLRQIGVEQLKKMNYIFPMYLYPKLVVPSRFNGIDQIGGLAPVPLLIVHGLGDTVVLPSHGEALFAAAGEPKKLMLLPDVGHVDGFNYEIDTIRPDVLLFIDQSLAAIVHEKTDYR